MNPMYEAIRNFGKQFDYVPEIVNKENIKPFKKIIVLGMGGSNLASGILNIFDQSLDIYVHRDYGLPLKETNFFDDSLIVASSYSGNTEEVLSGIDEALKKGMNVSVISAGGKLIQIAKEKDLPYIEFPNTGIQPRSALGFSFIALAHLINSKKAIDGITEIKEKLTPTDLEEEGKNIALKIAGFTPIIYSSNKNLAIAYNWKIKLNETGKIPAFCNVLPEMNHNEMTGFDLNEKTRGLAERFIPIFIFDDTDNEKIIKRMKVVKEIYESKGLVCVETDLKGSNEGERVFSSLLLADWIAYYTAINNGSEANEVPMVEDFKKRIL
ncbi:MAG: SIS domain-containing protein [Candidatus Paceibacterota bacterium]